jgi:hypothetical protein
MTISGERNEWAGGWYYSRLLFGTVSLINIFPRFLKIEDLFSSSDMRFEYGWYSLGRVYEISALEAYVLCCISIAGLLGFMYGKRFFHAGLIFWLISNSIYLTSEALNIKAYDRLSFFIGLLFLISPAYKENLRSIEVSKYPRILMLILFSSLYLSTGLNKLMYEPAWLSGEALSYHLNHEWHAGSSLALWISTMPVLMRCLSIFTLVFEISAGVLIWIARCNPYILMTGVLFHAGVEMVMNVGAFGLIVLSIYPVLIHPGYLGTVAKYPFSKHACL